MQSGRENYLEAEYQMLEFQEQCFQNTGVIICWEMNKDYEKLTSCLPDGILDNSKKF